MSGGNERYFCYTKGVEINSFTDPQPVRRIPIYTRTKDITVHRFQNTRAKLHRAFFSLGLVFSGLAISLLAFTVTPASFTTSAGEPQAAAVTPAVYVGESKSNTQALTYGPEPSFSNSAFFFETKTAFIEKKLTFIEADLSLMKLVFYEDGVPLQSVEIASKANEGSWCETPSGLYTVESKQKERTTAFQSTRQKWSIGFQGNFFIHAWALDAKTSGDGCIRLLEKDILALYDHAVIGTPILVHQSNPFKDNFKYEIPAPNVSADAYLVADLKSGEILTSKKEDEKRPIASVTKLVTALVVLDQIPLDTAITIPTSALSSTSVPRLAHVQKASAYALLFPLLLESSNEAAEVFSQYLGKERFVAHMNEKALSLGMKNTVFTDAVGLDDGNISTPHDLFQLSQYLTAHRSVILNISANIAVLGAKPQREFGDLNNFNKIKGISDFVGGKIGETNSAGQTALQLFEINVDGEARTIAIVVLHSVARSDDMKSLLKYVAKLYDVVLESPVEEVESTVQTNRYLGI